MTKIKLRYHCA